MASHGAREKTGRTVLEGRRMVAEALSSGVSFRQVVYSARLLQDVEGKNLIARLQAASIQMLYVTDRLMDEISGVEAPQGVMGVVSWAIGERDAFPLPHGGPALFVVAEEIQDPGNLGTLIRAAQAAGAHGVGVTKGTVEVMNPKTLRSCAGSIFRIPVFRLSSGWIDAALAQGLAVYSTVVAEGRPYDQEDWTQSVVVVLGNEGSGLAEVPGAKPISVPMVPTANSLNVAIAGSVILFHAASQRRSHGLLPTPPHMV
ncbi:MAG: RNA methyltransferase [Firmicutes bacterium]|nr:RNA methyltransferase [Bacillota bacterium]